MAKGRRRAERTWSAARLTAKRDKDERAGPAIAAPALIAKESKQAAVSADKAALPQAGPKPTRPKFEPNGSVARQESAQQFPRHKGQGAAEPARRKRAPVAMVGSRRQARETPLLGSPQISAAARAAQAPNLPADAGSAPRLPGGASRETPSRRWHRPLIGWRVLKRRPESLAIRCKPLPTCFPPAKQFPACRSSGQESSLPSLNPGAALLRQHRSRHSRAAKIEASPLAIDSPGAGGGESAEPGRADAQPRRTAVARRRAGVAGVVGKEQNRTRCGRFARAGHGCGVVLSQSQGGRPPRRLPGDGALLAGGAAAGSGTRPGSPGKAVKSIAGAGASAAAGVGDDVEAASAHWAHSS